MYFPAITVQHRARLRSAGRRELSKPGCLAKVLPDPRPQRPKSAQSHQSDPSQGLLTGDSRCPRQLRGSRDPYCFRADVVDDEMVPPGDQAVPIAVAVCG